MRCSWFQVDSPCLMSRSRAGGGLAGTGRSGGSGRAILISILTFFPRRENEFRTNSGEDPLQSQGTLAETSLKSLLEAAQGERSTGTLTVRNGSGKSASLYFLFGHLFHAQSDGMAGDDAVVSALTWNGGEFEFDPKAKLPSDETVKAAIPDLVQAAESTPQAAETG